MEFSNILNIGEIYVIIRQFTQHLWHFSRGEICWTALYFTELVYLMDI